MPNLLKNSIATFWVIFKQCGQMSKSFRVSIQKSRRMNKKKNGFCRPTFWTFPRFFKEQIDRDDEYGGRKCRRFYDSHGWIWLSWGAKAASQNGTSGNFKILKSNFSLFLVLEKNRFSQKIIIIFAMIYGRVDRWFYGWSSPIFAHICSTPCEHTIITSSFLRHLGERSHIIIMLGKCVCRPGFWKNQSSRKPHTQLFFCMCFCNSSQFSWVVITHAILEKAEKKVLWLRLKRLFVA